MRTANTTFVNLRAALDDVDPLVDASKPVAERLQPFLPSCAQPPPTRSRPIRDLDAIVRRPGKANDLSSSPAPRSALAAAAVGSGSPDCGRTATPTSPQRRRRRLLPGRLRRDGLRACSNGNPTLAIFRAYTPELVGWFDGFSHSGTIDASGGIGRIETDLQPVHASRPAASPTSAPRSRPTDLLRPGGPVSDQPRRRRCPGANERPITTGRPRRRLGPVHRRRRPRPATPARRARRAMRRIAAHRSASWPASPRASRSAAGADDAHTYEIEMYNAFGLVEGSEVRVAGVNAGSVTDLDDQRREARRGHGRAHRPARASSARTPKCSSRAAVADRRVLHRLPARGPAIEARRGDPEDPDIPAEHVEQTVQNDLVHEHAARAVQAPPAAADQRVRHRARRQPREPERGDPPRRAGADPDREGAARPRPTRTGSSATSTSTPTRSSAGSPSAARTSSASSRRRATRPSPRPSAATTSRRDFELLDDFLAELNPTLVELENVARRQHAAARPTCAARRRA